MPNFNPFESQVVIAGRYFPGMVHVVLDYIQKASNNGFKHVVVTEEEDVETALAAVKAQTERKITLLAHGPIGGKALRFLCEDQTDLPIEERRVQWCHIISVGLDLLRLHEIPEIVNPLPMTNGKSSQSRALAEYCIYSLLYFSRKTWQHQANLREHRWEPYNISELYGKKMVIFGYGDIGRETAKRATAFDMTVIGIRRKRAETEHDDLGTRVLSFEGDDLDAVLREADCVFNCMPATPQNVDYFNKERFAMMKPTAVYVNVGRGGTNSEADLIDALNNNVIRGAAVDVFKKEPLTEDYPLFQLPEDKILITSHNGAQTDNQMELLSNRIVDLARMMRDTGSVESQSIDKKYFY